MKQAVHHYERSHVSRARELRENSTDAERKLWSFLRRRALEGCRFRRQAPIGRYIVDFFCPEYGLIVELDGGQHADQRRRDEARTQWLASHGYRVIRFWNSDVLTNTIGVLEAIRSELIVDPKIANPSPCPSPSRGEGAPASSSLVPSPLEGEG